MRCESYNANKFNIMFHVCSLVVMSESPLNFKLQQERIKTCNSKPNSFFKKLFKGSWRCPAFLKNQCGKLPEPSNSPIYWKQMKNLSKPNASQKIDRWREMKGILEKNGKYDRLGKSLQERARLNTILWYFPRGEIILGVLEIPCTPQKSKWAAARTIQLAQKLEKKWKTYQNRTLPKKKFFGGKWRKYGRKREKHERLEKPL